MEGKNDKQNHQSGVELFTFYVNELYELIEKEEEEEEEEEG